MRAYVCVCTRDVCVCACMRYACVCRARVVMRVCGFSIHRTGFVYEIVFFKELSLFYRLDNTT